MNKTELVNAIAENAGLTKTDAGNALNSIISKITEVLKLGEEVVLTGFGTFSISNRSARTARNPKTGAPIAIEATRAVKFKTGKALKDAVKEEAVA